MNILLPPALTQAEESALMGRMAQGDMEARGRLIEGFLRFAMRVTLNTEIRGFSLEERFSSACVGLIQAVDSYNPARGAALKTYVVRCVLHRFQNDLRHRRYHPDAAVSLDEPVRGADGRNERTLGEILPEEGPPVLDRIAGEEERRALRAAVDAMPEDMRRYMRIRYFGERFVSQKDAGRAVGWSQMTANRRERVALGRCREALRTEGSGNDG